jgi:hypothetical protein
MLPFSSMITSKRKLEDAWKDETKSMAGSAPNELINMTLGLRDMVNGDYSIGAAKMPGMVEGLVGAYRMSEYGYIDRNGTKLPVQPGAMDTLKKALGFDPTSEAQYEDQSRIKSGLVAERQYRQQNIERHLQLAASDPDPAERNSSFQSWMGEAVKFTQDHPGMGNPLMRFSTSLAQRLQSGAVAGATGMPLGVKPQDFALQSKLGFVDTGR